MMASRLSPEVIGSLACPSSRPSSLEMLEISSSDLGVRVEIFEHIARRGQQVDLVGGDQRAQRQRIVLHLRHRLAVDFRLVVDGAVDAFDHHLFPPQHLHPQRKDLHDG